MYTVNETLVDMMTASKMINALEMILNFSNIDSAIVAVFYYRATLSVKENKKNSSSKTAFRGQICLMMSYSCMNI